MTIESSQVSENFASIFLFGSSWMPAMRPAVTIVHAATLGMRTLKLPPSAARSSRRRVNACSNRRFRLLPRFSDGESACSSIANVSDLAGLLERPREAHERRRRLRLLGELRNFGSFDLAVAVADAVARLGLREVVRRVLRAR